MHIDFELSRIFWKQHLTFFIIGWKMAPSFLAQR